MMSREERFTGPQDKGLVIQPQERGMRFSLCLHEKGSCKIDP